MPKFDTNGPTRRGLIAGLGAGAGTAALLQAGRAEAALLPRPETVRSFDTIVVGSGLAGCAAALEAAEAGARVVLLEKAAQNRMGGNSLLAGGTFAVPRNGSESARQGYVEDFQAYTSDRGNSEIFRLMAENILSDIEWLESHGIEMLPATPRPLVRTANVTVAPGSFAGMPRFFRRMRTRLAELGIAVEFDTKARQLVMNSDGAVSGVRAVGPQGLAEFEAGSVVVATGGYAGNSQLLEAYSDPGAGAMMVRGIEWATGDGLLMAQQAGAGLKGMGGLMALHVAAVDRLETAAGQPARVVPHAVSINRQGRRFVDESLGYVTHGKAVMGQPDQTTMLVIDKTIREIPEAEAVFGTFARLGLTIHEADSLEELAQITEVPVDEFLQTITDFNAAVKDGAAPQAAPPKAALANRIETPPFYAFYPLGPGITLTFGGIMIDGRARALEADGRVLPGLYAAGEGAGAVFFNDYIGGGSMTNCLVMGRIAGRQAAG